MFRDGLERLKEKHKIIREVRGKGLMIGVEMKFEVKDILFDGIANNLSIALFWKKHTTIIAATSNFRV